MAELLPIASIPLEEEPGAGASPLASVPIQTEPIASFPIESGPIASFPLDSEGIPIPQEQATAKPEVEPLGVLGQAWMGAKEALVPFALDKEELAAAEPQTAEETAARLVGRVGTDIATTALASLALTPAGAWAVRGAIGGLGVYRALGTEAIHTTATGEATSGARVLTNLAVEVNPWLHYGSKSLAAATQAALGAGQAVSYGAGAGGALVAGALGGAAGALAAKSQLAIKAFHEEAGIVAADLGLGERSAATLVKNVETFVPEVSRRLKADPSRYGIKASGEFLSSEPYSEAALQEATRLAGPIKLDKAAKYLAKMQELPEGSPQLAKMQAAAHGAQTPEELAGQLWLDGEKFAKARWLVKPKGDMPKAELLKRADKVRRGKGWGAEEVNSYWQTRQAWQETIIDHVTRTAAVINGGKDPLNNMLWRKLGDLSYVLADIEDKSGIPLISSKLKLVEAHNSAQTELDTILSETDPLRKMLTKDTLDPNKVTEYLEFKDKTKIPAEYQPAVKAWRAELDFRRQYAKDAWGVDLGYLEEYVPHKLAPPEVRAKQVADATRGMSLGQILAGAEANTPGFGEITGALQYTLGRSLKTTDDVTEALALIRSGETRVKGRIGVEAGAAFERDQYMPKLLREMDITKLHLNYVANLVHAGKLSGPLQELSDKIPILRAAGWGRSADYLEDYLLTISGKQGEYGRLSEAGRVKWKIKFQQLIDSAGGEDAASPLLKAARDVPELMSFMSSQIYPNFMGFRIMPVMRNMTQVPLMVGPEIGLRGMPAFFRGVAAFARDPKKFLKILDEQGLRVAEQSFEGKAMYDQALRDSLPEAIRGAAPLVQKINRWGMAAFQVSDRINRGITAAISDELHAAFRAKAPWAVKWVQTKLPKAFRDELLAAGSDTEQQAVLRSYLVGKTQFDYGKIGMNQLGRELGSWAMMFSKWPASIASDAVWQVKREGLRAGAGSVAAKMLAPMALLYWVNSLSGWEESPRAQALLGSRLYDIAPARSLSNLGSHPYLTIVQGTGKLVSGSVEELAKAASGDFSAKRAGARLGRAAGDIATPLVPLAYGAWRGWKNLDQLLTGRKETP